MNQPNEFFDYIITQFFARMHEYPADNYDALRFSYDGVDRSHEFDVGMHKAYLYFFLQNFTSLHGGYLRMEDERSKKLFLDLILFRLAGHLHVKLDTNTDVHWILRGQADRVPASPSSIQYAGMFGPVQHFDDVPFAKKRLKVDCWRANIIWTFFIQQYFFERGPLAIQPREGDHVVDSGACFGDTALAFAAAVGPAGRVYAFEPVGKHLEIIRHNVAQNPSLGDTIRVFPVGLGDVSHPQVEPVRSDFLNPGFSLSGMADQGAIPLETLDNLVARGEVERVDFIKMDVEGAELAGLRGAEQTLRRFRPRLAISVYHRAEDPYEIPAYLDSLGLGYKFYLEHYTIHAEETVLYAIAPPA
jgi:FkbM family methyltransferase